MTGTDRERLMCTEPVRLVLRAVDRVLAGLVSLGSWLVLPVLLLLFGQWPLRDLVHAYSREANDLGQWLFAVYVAVAVTAATRAGAHLAADGFARRYSRRTRLGLRRGAIILVLLPWTVAVLVAGWPVARNAALALERFSDTGNPGYFVVKLAVMLLAAMMLLQGVLELRRRRSRGPDPL